LSTGSSLNRQGDGEELLSLESLDEGVFVFVVDCDDTGTFGNAVGASLASDCGDCVISGLDDMLGQVLANTSAGLYRVSDWVMEEELGCLHQ
jgi:hypothetical protein